RTAQYVQEVRLRLQFDFLAFRIKELKGISFFTNSVNEVKLVSWAVVGYEQVFNTHWNHNSIVSRNQATTVITTAILNKAHTTMGELTIHSGCTTQTLTQRLLGRSVELVSSFNAIMSNQLAEELRRAQSHNTSHLSTITKVVLDVGNYFFDFGQYVSGVSAQNEVN